MMVLLTWVARRASHMAIWRGLATARDWFLPRIARRDTPVAALTALRQAATERVGWGERAVTAHPLSAAAPPHRPAGSETPRLLEPGRARRSRLHRWVFDAGK